MAGPKDDRIVIRCRETTKKDWKKMVIDLEGDDDSYEDILDTVLHVYDDHPEMFERKHRQDSDVLRRNL